MNNGLNFPNHAMYEPPVILPSALTNNQYIMVFTSNLIAGYGIQYGGAVFYSTSPNGVGNWTTPSVLIENITVDNICDMADARPVWDGSRWHIFIQAVTGNYKSGSCSPTNNVYESGWYAALESTVNRLELGTTTGHKSRPAGHVRYFGSWNR